MYVVLRKFTFFRYYKYFQNKFSVSKFKEMINEDMHGHCDNNHTRIGAIHSWVENLPQN